MGQEKDALRLLLIDDHLVLVDGLCHLLALEPDFDVVGVASNALDGIELAQRLAPDIVITDMSLGTHTGLHVISELRKLAPTIRVLVLTCHRHYVKAALSAGARGYVLKDVHRADLVQAIRAVASGYYLLDTPVSESFISCYLAQEQDPMPVPPSSLTERERTVIALIAQGASGSRIAKQLHLSTKTIAKHRANAMRKAKLRSTAAITAYAISHRLDLPSL
jgi:DNA-binding NarL/FixJ family response regulator